jgi:hypothetical protein
MASGSEYCYRLAVADLPKSTPDTRTVHGGPLPELTYHAGVSNGQQSRGTHCVEE